jgi:hypothetical protein
MMLTVRPNRRNDLHRAAAGPELLFFHVVTTNKAADEDPRPFSQPTDSSRVGAAS